MTPATASMSLPGLSSPVKSCCSTVRAPASSDRSPRMPTSTKAGSGHRPGRIRRAPGLPSGSGSTSAATASRMAWLRLLAHGRDACLVDEAELGHLGCDAVQRVAGPPRGLFLLGAVAEGAAGERAVLVEEAVDERLDRDRALARPQPLLRPLHGQVHGERVHAVDPPGRDAEAERAPRQPRLAGGLRDGGRDGVEVVLDEEAERQVPRGGQVEALQHRADVGRTVAEVGDREVVGAGVLLGPGVARRHRHAAPDDGVGAERPGLEPLQVHGTAAPAAETLGEPEDLGEGALQHGRDLRRHEVPPGRARPWSRG